MGFAFGNNAPVEWGGLAGSGFPAQSLEWTNQANNGADNVNIPMNNEVKQEVEEATLDTQAPETLSDLEMDGLN